MARPGRWDASLDGDLRLVDGWEEVTLLRQAADGSFDRHPDPVFALRETVDKRTAAGQVEAAELVWHLDAADVGDDGCRVGDRLEDDAGVLWIATGATLAGASDQWRLPCLRVPVSEASGS